ncbi:alpha/beta hydrolase [candidate division KSB1 bacterium]|nr:alpha/beta hydrolase [candidate division KSB1 bacterium]
MSSLRSRLFVFVLKYRHLLKGQLKRTNSIDWTTSIPKLREEIERGAGFFGKLPDTFELTAVKLGNLRAEWMRPAEAPKDKAMLYFHGGGLVVGSISAHRSIVAKFVNGTGISALVFDYALAPEHPFPEGLNDSVAAYQYLLNEAFKPAHIVFVGDSGGGNLVLATLLALKEKNIPLPAGAVTLSAWTDLTNSGESFHSNSEVDSLCWKDAQIVFSKYYAGDNDPSHSLISPLFGDLAGLPPLLMYAGNDELMRDDSTRFAERAQKAGVDVTLRIGEGLFHCYPACAPMFPEATTAMNEICAFIKEHVGEKP